MEEKRPLIQDYQPLLWLFYLLGIGIGMLFEYEKYRHFGINIFEYADLFDFLLAPVSDLGILLLSLGILVLGYLYFNLDDWLGKKHPRFHAVINFGIPGKVSGGVYRFVSFILVTGSLLYLAAVLYGKHAGYTIRNQPPVEVRFMDNEKQTGILIGKTRDTLFLLQGGKTRAIPITAALKEYLIR